MSTLIKFEKIENARDLGGMKTKDGVEIRPGSLFRSGHLADATDSDVACLSELIGTVVDFRTDVEHAQQPDREIPGVTYYHFPAVESLTPGISREKESYLQLVSDLLLKPAEAREYMCSTYKALVEDFAVSQYRRFLEVLLESEGGVLWHCTAGKDRAGIASVIVEEILGVSRETILADYLKTNEYLKENTRFLSEYVKKQSGIDSPLADESIRYLFGAEKEYLDSYYEAAEEKYGSFEAFLQEGLGISREKAEKLKQKMLV